MYRLYTEDVNRSVIEAVLLSIVNGWTFITAKGAWQGNKENSLIIELLDASEDEAIQISQLICSANNQQSVAVVYQPVQMQFVAATFEAVA